MITIVIITTMELHTARKLVLTMLQIVLIEYTFD